MSQRQAILGALIAAGPNGVTNGELNRLGIFRYSARIHELREQGYQIRTETGPRGLARFFLESSPERPSSALGEAAAVDVPPAAPLSVSPPSDATADGGGEQAALFDAPPVPISAITGKRAA